MAENAIVKILTALLKHQVKRTLGEETLGVIGQELAGIGGDKVDAWIGEQATPEQLEKAAMYAHQCFRGKVNDNDLEQWMVSLPLGNLPKVVEALEELPKSPDETKLENALQESVSLSWKNLSAEQVNNAVNAFLSCLRSALLPIEKQTLMVIGRSVLRMEDKVDLLVRWFEQYIITGKFVAAESLKPEPAQSWNLKHRYGLAAHFTGRIEERKELVRWLEQNPEQPLYVLRALGGFGKSALAWFWLLHDVDKSKWTRVVWWGFYEDSNFESFLSETLGYLVGRDSISPYGARQQVEMLLKEMERQNILIVLDGFERALRAFSSMGAAYQEDEAPAPKVGGEAKGDGKVRDLDCVSLVAEEFLRGVASSGGLLRSKVLMTTRLTPRALSAGTTPESPLLAGCLERELLQMEPADAVAFFQRQGALGARAEIENACAPYGFHPLSLSLLAGLVVNDKRQPRDIAAAGRYEQKVSADAKGRQHHVLEQSYAGLSPESQALLGALACFRSSVTYDTLTAVNQGEKAIQNLNETLDDLVSRGLVHHTTHLLSNQPVSAFDLHPIVRRYAYDRLTATDRTDAHARLVDYFAAVPRPQKVSTLEDLAPVIELYHHTIRAGKLDEACDLFYDRINKPTFYQFGAYQLRIELFRALFPDGEDKPPRLKKEGDQAWTLNALANSYSLSGQPRRAIPLFEMQIAIREKEGNKKSVAIGLGNVATQQLVIGALSEAERNLRRYIELSIELGVEDENADAYHELGRVLSYRGEWQEAERDLLKSQSVFDKYGASQTNFVSVVHAYRALRFLLMTREQIIRNQSPVDSVKSAIQCAKRALELADETAKTQYPHPRDYVRAYWLLGAAYRTNNDLTLAEENLSKAINICRGNNTVEAEAEILLDIARLRYAQGDFKDAQEKASEALMITERSGYVLQGADVHLFMAEMAMAGITNEKLGIGEGKMDNGEWWMVARKHAEEALRLARCEGPPYYYKVAYEEAERMLERLK